MYLKPYLGCLIAVGSLLACEMQTEESTPAPGEVDTLDTAETTIPGVQDDVAIDAPEAPDEPDVVIDSAETARQVAQGQGIEAQYSERTQRTADGERVQVFVPEPAPSVEVSPGEPCGTTDANGMFLSCAPGSYCLKATESTSGSCVAGPTAVPLDG